jgi:threonine synthase
MVQSLQYFSTNHKAPKVTFGEALLQGLAPDKGPLYARTNSNFYTAGIANFASQEYYEIACAVFSKFLRNDIPYNEYLQCVKKHIHLIFFRTSIQQKIHHAS